MTISIRPMAMGANVPALPFTAAIKMVSVRKNVPTNSAMPLLRLFDVLLSGLKISIKSWCCVSFSYDNLRVHSRRRSHSFFCPNGGFVIMGGDMPILTLVKAKEIAERPSLSPPQQQLETTLTML